MNQKGIAGIIVVLVICVFGAWIANRIHGGPFDIGGTRQEDKR